jgi:proteasome lid subunit RPN8/RPN11
MGKIIGVTIDGQLLEAMLELAWERHPREVVLLLRGRYRGDRVEIDDFLLPPLAVSGMGFAEFPIHLLPIDFSILGTAHSHPSESLAPSPEDLNNFYGLVMMIFAYPYSPSRSAVFNRRGERIPLRILGG